MFRTLLYSATLFASSAAIAGNLLTCDSSFETGTDSIGLEPKTGRVQVTTDKLSFLPHGAQCAKLRPASGSVICKPFDISQSQNGKTFTFSLFAKAEKDGEEARLFIFKYENNEFIATQPISLSKNWKRYLLTAPIKGGKIGLGMDFNSQSAVWIDALQLEQKNTASEYTLTPEFAIGATIPAENNYVFFKGESIPILIHAINFSSKDLDSPIILLKITDCFGKTVSEIRKNVDGRDFKWNYKFTPEKLGWYKIQAGLVSEEKTLSETLRAVSVVEPPVKIKEGRWPFCGNCHTYVMYPKGLERIGGLKWVEFSIKWKFFEPEKGNYKKLPDLERFRKEGLKCKLTLGHMPSVPEWAWDKDDVADCRKRKMKEPRFGFLPAEENMEEWRKFIRYIAESCKGKIDIIEFGGEDDLTFGGNSYYLCKQKNSANLSCGKLTGGPDYNKYAEMLKIACEETRKIDPAVKIGIVRPSGGDCFANKYSFSSPSIKTCKNSFDLFPLDPYCYPRYIGPGQPETALPEDFLPEALKGALETCLVNGKGQNVYISELGYALDFNTEPDSSYSMEMVKRLSRAYLIARMTKNIELFHWFHPNSYGCVEGGKYHYGLWRFGMPLPMVPAYSAVARIVENVEGSKELAPGGESKAVVFKKDGRADAAVWFVRGNGKMMFDSIPQDLVVSDVMGNNIKPGNIILINEFPTYFSLEGKDSFEKLSAILSDAKMKCRPVSISFATPRTDKGMLRLKNIAGADINAKVVMNKMIKEVQLQNGQAMDLEFPIDGDTIATEIDCGQLYDKVTASYPLSFESCRKIDFKGKIDADLSKWEGRPFIAMNERSQIMPPDPWIDWKSPDQFSAKVYTAWDEKYFYMATEVKDSIHSNSFPREIYKGDSIQFAFDLLSESCARGYDKNDRELGIALSNGKTVPAQWTKNPNVWKNSEYIVKRSDKEKKTFYEMRIPLETLGIKPEKGTVFGFNFVIFNDDTGTGANYYYQFAPGITEGKNAAAFRKFTMTE